MAIIKYCVFIQYLCMTFNTKSFSGDSRALVERGKILASLCEKALSRGIDFHANAFDVPAIRENAATDYDRLAEEIQGYLPDFNSSFDRVAAFYRSLPWS